MSKQRILVAGAGGFIGGHLIKRLAQDPNVSLRAVDIKPFDQWYQRLDGVENLVLDLREIEACRQATKDIDEVYNLACNMGGMGYIKNFRTECMLSVLISTHMLMACTENKVQRYFYSSSACVYNGDKQTDPNVTALKEEDAYPALPEDGYGWEKTFFRTSLPPFHRRTRLGHPRLPFS